MGLKERKIHIKSKWNEEEGGDFKKKKLSDGNTSQWNKLALGISRKKVEDLNGICMR